MTRDTRSSTASPCTSTGQAAQGRQVLERTARRHPGNTDILGALVAFSREAGDDAAARRWAAALEAARR